MAELSTTIAGIPASAYVLAAALAPPASGRPSSSTIENCLCSAAFNRSLDTSRDQPCVTTV
eukprot:6489350-Ditylum_brightwellii.AAC.1